MFDRRHRLYLIIASKIDDPRPSIVVGGCARQANERAASLMERRAATLEERGDDDACRKLRSAARSARRRARRRSATEAKWSGTYGNGRAWRVHLVEAPTDCVPTGLRRHAR